MLSSVFSCLETLMKHSPSLYIKYDQVKSVAVFLRIRQDKKSDNLSSWRYTRWEWTSRSTKKSWRHPEKNSLRVMGSWRGAFQCTTWLLWKKLAASKLNSQGGKKKKKKKKSWGARSIWKSTTKLYELYASSCTQQVVCWKISCLCFAEVTQT